jgi:hypothetical protein
MYAIAPLGKDVKLDNMDNINPLKSKSSLLHD